jgi:ribose/xylose/arabinose/galactoside ABC-type transport system permease subunit
MSTTLERRQSGQGWNLPTANLGRLLPLASVMVLVLFFGLTSDAFLSWRNFTGLAGQASTLLLACLGATFVILMGGIDLSVGAITLLCGAVAVLILNALDLGVLAVVPVVLLGALLGSLNGAVHTYGVIPSFVVTLGSLSLFSGLALQLLEGRAIRFDSLGFEELAIGQLIGGVPNIFLVAIVAWAAMVFVNFRTRFGRYMFIIGGGEAVARTAGIPVRRYKIYAFAVSGALAGLAGAMAVARLGAAGPTLGSELLLNSLAAIVVGGTSLSGGVGGVHRTLIGVLIIALLDNGLNLLGVNQYTQMMIKGAVVVLAVLVSADRSKFTVMK